MRTESAFVSASDSFAQILVQQLVVAEHRSALPSANCLALKSILVWTETESATSDLRRVVKHLRFSTLGTRVRPLRSAFQLVRTCRVPAR
jgi:hypothetical protein